jgi:hypothetical protein
MKLGTTTLRKEEKLVWRFLPSFRDKGHLEK